MFPLQGAGWSVFRCYSVMFRYWSPGSAFPVPDGLAIAANGWQFLPDPDFLRESIDELIT